VTARSVFVAATRSLFEDALPLAVAGLRAATARVTDTVTNDGDGRFGQALVETLWWQKSIEDLWQEQEGEAFYRRRDATDGGMAVAGLAYARNVGGHRVDRTYDEVVYRAASAVESVVLAGFSAWTATGGDGPRWPALADLPPLPMEDPFGRAEMYSQRIAGRPVLEPLHAALGFFEDLLAP
jgi:hypothetical protein